MYCNRIWTIYDTDFKIWAGCEMCASSGRNNIKEERYCIM